MILNDTSLYEVETSNNSYDALKQASSKDYDLLISDVQMPGMNGDLLYRKLGIDPQDDAKILPRPKLLLMSGVLDEMIMNGTHPFSGASGVLQKPFSPALLISAVHSALREN